MSARAAARAAWSLWALALGLEVGGLVFLALGWRSWQELGFGNPVVVPGFALLQMACATIGALIVSRQPRNAVGWIFCLLGVLLGLGALTDGYMVHAQSSRPGTLPAGEIAAWVGNIVTGPVGPGLLGFLLLLFPNGRPPSPRWRKVVWFHATAVALLVLRQALSPGPLDVYGFVENPFGVEALRGALTAVEAPIFVLLLASLLASALSVVMRFRRAAGEERQQIKWLASSGTLLAVTFALGPVIWSVPALEGTFWSLLFLLVSSTIPLSVGAAVLRYRLYDIDLIINRTLVYGALTATLALVYLGSVVGLQYVLRTLTGQESQLAIVASTLAIAALFGPLRRRIQGVIDRRFYRRKYDAERTLAGFSSKLRDETDLDRLGDELVAVVRETLQPEYASLWLRLSGKVGGEER